MGISKGGKRWLTRFWLRFFFIGPCYTLFAILLITFVSLWYICPALFGTNNFDAQLLFAYVVVSEVAVNFSLFMLRSKTNRFEWLLRREQRQSLPFSSYATLGAHDRVQEAFSSKFCTACQMNVPKLCQHCSLCNYCVFKKDHHCFFLGGCVGFGNQRHFIVFLFWAFIGSAYALYLCVVYVHSYVKPLWPFGFLDCLIPVYLTKRLIYWDIDLTELAMVLYLSTVFSTAAASFMFLIAQWLFVLTGRSMMGYFTVTDVFLGKDNPTIHERILLVFGRYWLLNFLVPLPCGNQLDSTYRRALYSQYVKVL